MQLERYCVRIRLWVPLYMWIYRHLGNPRSSSQRVRKHGHWIWLLLLQPGRRKETALPQSLRHLVAHPRVQLLLLVLLMLLLLLLLRLLLLLVVTAEGGEAGRVGRLVRRLLRLLMRETHEIELAGESRLVLHRLHHVVLEVVGDPASRKGLLELHRSELVSVSELLHLLKIVLVVHALRRAVHGASQTERLLLVCSLLLHLLSSVTLGA